MNPHEVVVHEVDCQRVLKIFNLFAESLGQPREASVLHPEREILPFDIARGDMFSIRFTVHLGFLRRLESGGAVSLLVFFVRWRSVDLDELGEINIVSESGLNGIEMQQHGRERENPQVAS